MRDRQCRGFNTWGEEAEHYHSLSQEAKRHWRIEGHAYHVSQRLENQGKSPEENWLQAEAEIRHGEELHDLWQEKSRTTDRGKKALLSAIYYLAYGAKVRISSISDTTPLPKKEDDRQLLYRNVTEELMAERLNLPETVQTIGELVAFVIANYRQRLPQHHTTRTRGF